MSISGISNYYSNDALYKWQGQQLKSTGASSSSTSSMAASLLSRSSMTSQIASLVELTKYAMNAMGLSSDSRVTFSQITKYREQLQSEFNNEVKNAIANSGISDLTSLSYTLDKDGKISVSGGSADDRKKAQSWFDANPSYGTELRKSMTSAGIDESQSINFSISTTGRMTVINNDEKNIQAALDENADLTENFRAGLEKAGIRATYPLEFDFDEDGNLRAIGDDAAAINDWLAENTEMADEVKKQIKKYDIDASAVSLRLGESGNIQISVNNADNNDIQAVLDKSDAGSKITSALSSLGIDKNINFSIQINDDGTLNIISDHPDRDKIQALFEENPELLKKYRQIETLAGIDDAREAMQISPSAMRKRIQVESMVAWWADSGSANSYFGNYGSDGFSLLAGLNLNV